MRIFKKIWRVLSPFLWFTFLFLVVFSCYNRYQWSREAWLARTDDPGRHGKEMIVLRDHAGPVLFVNDYVRVSKRTKQAMEDCVKAAVADLPVSEKWWFLEVSLPSKWRKLTKEETACVQNILSK